MFSKIIEYFVKAMFEPLDTEGSYKQLFITASRRFVVLFAWFALMLLLMFAIFGIQKIFGG
jgi:hypothetical protein